MRALPVIAALALSPALAAASGLPTVPGASRVFENCVAQTCVTATFTAQAPGIWDYNIAFQSAQPIDWFYWGIWDGTSGATIGYSENQFDYGPNPPFELGKTTLTLTGTRSFVFGCGDPSYYCFPHWEPRLFQASVNGVQFDGPTTATPEPMTALLVGAGLAGVGAVRRRRAGAGPRA
jgi:hypothetical protein